jgi:DNA-directed RNA polymerase specialized sigma24 family protein
MVAGLWLSREGKLLAPPDPAEEVAVVATARRAMLLRVHRFRLRKEDLEDCYSQATLELMQRARRGGAFAGRRHLANALEQRFLSRIHDRRRALAGRSPIEAAIEGAVPLGDFDEERLAIVDRRAELEQLVLLRFELQRIEALARRLTPDQRLVLASQLAQLPPGEFCAHYGWSAEKYRKVAQRARARLRRLTGDEGGVPLVSGGSEEPTGTSL